MSQVKFNIASQQPNRNIIIPPAIYRHIHYKKRVQLPFHIKLKKTNETEHQLKGRKTNFKIKVTKQIGHTRNSQKHDTLCLSIKKLATFKKFRLIEKRPLISL